MQQQNQIQTHETEFRKKAIAKEAISSYRCNNEVLYLRLAKERIINRNMVIDHFKEKKHNYANKNK